MYIFSSFIKIYIIHLLKKFTQLNVQFTGFYIFTELCSCHDNLILELLPIKKIYFLIMKCYILIYKIRESIAK